MRPRKPHPASLDEVVIRRAGHEAVIDFREPGFATTHLQLGADADAMSDGEILHCFNETLRTQLAAVEAYENVAVEIPPGQPQIRFFEAGEQWTPRGSVLRCLVDDGGPQGEAIIHVDDVELSLAEFGRLLCTYAGWGMRICFVPEERLEESPEIEIGTPEDEPGAIDT